VSKKLSHVPVGYGNISLAEREGKMFKRSLLCRTGNFKGIYGPVEVTEDRLKRLAEKYNASRAQPQNENDFAPILKDHFRAVDNVLGRLLADLSVLDWTDPESGATLKGLYGTLRVDDPEAQEKVEQGLYAHLSISFDEETDELFEISFVAVEAARRSIVLAKGDTDMSFEVKLQQLQQQHSGLVARVSAALEARKAVCLSLVQNLAQNETDITALAHSMTTAATALRTAALKASFKGFVRQGKMTAAELGKVDFAKLAALPDDARAVVLGAYDARPVSADIQQFGQSGAQPIDSAKLADPAEMRKLIALQKEGKGLAALADGAGDAEKDKDGKEGGEKKPPAAAGAEADKDKAGDSMSYEDVEAAIKSIDSLGESVSKISASMKRMGDMLKKLQESDEKDPAKEQEQK
jgi:hypothetical protein